MGCRFILFNRFKKRAHFQFRTNQKAAIQFSSTDFNLLVFSWFNSKILILKFDRLQSQTNQNLTTINQFQDSDLNFQKIQPDFWFLNLLNSIFSNSSKSDSGSSNSWVFDLQSWFSNWFNQRFLGQNFQIPDFKILFLDEIQIPDFYSKAA